MDFSAPPLYAGNSNFVLKQSPLLHIRPPRFPFSVKLNQPPRPDGRRPLTRPLLLSALHRPHHRARAPQEPDAGGGAGHPRQRHRGGVRRTLRARLQPGAVALLQRHVDALPALPARWVGLRWAVEWCVFKFFKDCDRCCDTRGMFSFYYNKKL